MAFRLTRSNLKYGQAKKYPKVPPGVTQEQLRLNTAAHRAAEQAGTLRRPRPGEKETVYNPRTGATSVESLVAPKLKWSAPKVNTVKGNARQGSSYRVAYDAAGNKYHRYSEEAGGIPAEVVRVTKSKKAQRNWRGV